MKLRFTVQAIVRCLYYANIKTANIHRLSHSVKDTHTKVVNIWYSSSIPTHNLRMEHNYNLIDTWITSIFLGGITMTIGTFTFTKVRYCFDIASCKCRNIKRCRCQSLFRATIDERMHH